MKEKALDFYNLHQFRMQESLELMKAVAAAVVVAPTKLTADIFKTKLYTYVKFAIMTLS